MWDSLPLVRAVFYSKFPKVESWTRLSSMSFSFQTRFKGGLILKKLREVVAVVLIVFLFIPPLLGGHRNSPNLAETVDLPLTFDFDLSLASKMRSDMGASRDLPLSGEAAETGRSVFNDLTGSAMVSSLGLPYRWTLSVIGSPLVNAESLPDGEVVAYEGLAQLIGSNRGLWAAVLSHEIAHVERRHAVRKALYHLYIEEQLRYYQIRARYDKNAAWAAMALSVAGPIAEKKLSRDLEHDADEQGMLLMARAGYHPDNVFALHHLLRLATGEQSKFGAFFSDHPRWETRDQRSDHAYTEALAEYNQLYPDPTLSPGGTPPVVAFLGAPKTSKSEQRSTGNIVMAVSCRNAKAPITIVVHLSDKEGRPLTNPDDSVVRRHMVCADRDDAVPTTVYIPSTIAAVHERMLKARIDFLGPDGSVLERSRQIDVALPKIGEGANALAKTEIEPALANDTVFVEERPHETLPSKKAPGLERKAALPPSAKAATSGVYAGTVDPGTNAKTRSVAPALETRRTGQKQYDAFASDSALIAEWYNLRELEGGSFSHGTDSTSPTSAMASAGEGTRTGTGEEASIGVWSNENPRIRHDGVKMVGVVPNGPADQAGLQSGDVVLAIDGVYVYTLEELMVRIHCYQPGAKVSLRYSRYSTIYDTFVVMGAESKRVASGGGDKK